MSLGGGALELEEQEERHGHPSAYLLLRKEWFLGSHEVPAGLVDWDKAMTIRRDRHKKEKFYGIHGRLNQVGVAGKAAISILLQGQG